MKVRPLIIIFWALCNFGCGVKGDPLPPEKPPELWRAGQKPRVLQPPVSRSKEDERLEPQPDQEEESDGRFF